jgi:NADH-quinone oxidoreductase subunit L
MENPLHFEFDMVLSILSVGSALGGIIIGYLLYQENYINQPIFKTRVLKSLNNIISRKYYLDDVYDWIISNIVNNITSVVSYVDRVFINDIIINSPGEAIKATSNKLRYIQTGKVYNYAFFIVLSISIIVLLWIFIETGKIL